MQRLDLKNKRYGRLLLLEYKESNKRGAALWYARCDCGKPCVVVGRRVAAGVIQSCGCLQRERSAESLSLRMRRHGMTKTPEWLAWRNMNARCYAPHNVSFHRYGGRGITVVPAWHKFEAFFADMGLRPSPKHSVERIDNDGPYGPENCRWATVGEQASNRRNNRYLIHNGERLTQSELARRLGLSVQVVHLRLKAGWTVERIAQTPVEKRRPRQS